MAWWYALTCAVTWTTWSLASRLAGPSYTGVFGARGPLFLLGVIAPGVVATGFVARAEGRTGVARLLAGIGRWQVGSWPYLVALFYLVGVKLTAAVLHRAIAGEWPRFGDVDALAIVGALLVSTWVQAGEEVGWRAYALTRLADRIGLAAASIGVGAAWAVWHLPLFFIPGSGSTGQSFPMYLLHTVALSVAMARLYHRTGRSLLLVMLMHAAVNNTTHIVPAATPGASAPFSFDGSLVGWLVVAVSWGVAAVLLPRMRGVTLRDATPSLPPSAT